MISIILVSHSSKITDGLKEMIEEMVGSSNNIKIFSAGGTGDGRLGTNTITILEIIEQCKDDQNILIFSDIGSAVMSAETAIELVENINLKNKIHLIDAPLVEGAFVAAVQAMVDSDLDAILSEIENI